MIFLKNDHRGQSKYLYTNEDINGTSDDKIWTPINTQWENISLDKYDTMNFTQKAIINHVFQVLYSKLKYGNPEDIFTRDDDDFLMIKSAIEDKDEDKYLDCNIDTFKINQSVNSIGESILYNILMNDTGEVLSEMIVEKLGELIFKRASGGTITYALLPKSDISGYSSKFSDHMKDLMVNDAEFYTIVRIIDELDFPIENLRAIKDKTDTVRIDNLPLAHSLTGAMTSQEDNIFEIQPSVEPGINFDNLGDTPIDKESRIIDTNRYHVGDIRDTGDFSPALFNDDWTEAKEVEELTDEDEMFMDILLNELEEEESTDNEEVDEKSSPIMDNIDNVIEKMITPDNSPIRKDNIDGTTTGDYETEVKVDNNVLTPGFYKVGNKTIEITNTYEIYITRGGN